MNPLSPLTAEMADLLESLCLEELSPADAARLEELVRTDPECCRQYVVFIEMHALVERFEVEQVGNLPEKRSAVSGERSAAPVSAAGAAVELPHQLGAPDAELLIPPIIIDTSAGLPSPVSAFGSSLGAWLFSYGVATLITGVAILGAWAYKIRHDPQETNIAGPTSGSTTPPMTPEGEPQPTIVGRISGTADCRWADPETALLARTMSVPLAGRYALRSGLMEISYDSGAKVILQGPATYEVDSSRGGFLSLGKLTARVETKADGGRGKVEGTDDQKSKIRNQNSPFPLPPSPFVVRTPTAIITDLGTEFGVEVSKEGDTTSHVFRGSVKVQVVAGDGRQRERVLGENESAHIKTDGGGKAVVTVIQAAESAKFVRRIPNRTLQTLDLADVVAGGDGFSGRRDAGIDSANGRATTTDHAEPDLASDGRYHRAQSSPLVDGVFIPHGRNRPVQVDSAGHVFDRFTNSENLAAGYAWAPGPDPNSSQPTLSWLGGVDYRTAGHGLIFLHANNGITFNLDAIRRANPGCKLLRFRAVGGSTNALADLWVLVDGKPRFQQRQIDKWSGPFPIAIPIDEKDRFLTLASTTDRADGIEGSWIIFGDPVLQMVSEESEKRTERPPVAAAFEKKETKP